MLTHAQRSGSALITAGFLLSAPTMLQAADYRYSIIEIGDPIQAINAVALTDSGLIYGSFDLPGNSPRHAMHISVTNQATIDMGALNSFNYSSRINAAGDTNWAAGVSDGPTSHDEFATIWRPVAGGHEIIDPGHLDIGPNGAAVGVNRLGQVVGYSRAVHNSDRRPFLWQDGTLTALPLFADTDDDTAPTAINDLGHIVGSRNTLDDRVLPVMWTDDDGDGNYLVEEIGDLTGQRIGEAAAVNILDEVVGQYRGQGFLRGHAFYWSRASGLRDIHDPQLGVSSKSSAINNRSEIVGSVFTDLDYLYPHFAFHWTADEGMIDLNDYIPPRANAILRSAAAINDAGQIAVSGTIRDQRFSTVYLLSPVHPTMTLDTLGHGGDLIAGSRNALRITGATPGSSVKFYWSERGGATAIPGCDLQVNSLQITAPTLIGTAVADASGSAIIDRVIPNAARDKIVLLQAAVPGECAVSQLLVKQIH